MSRLGSTGPALQAPPVLSLAGMSRLGSTGPALQAPPDGPAPPAAAPGWTRLQLSGPGESLHFDKRHWAASAITGPALERARHIAAGLAGVRGWNDRIITETSRALTVVLAGHQPGDMIAWSQLPAALHRRDLSITRTAEESFPEPRPARLGVPGPNPPRHPPPGVPGEVMQGPFNRGMLEVDAGSSRPRPAGSG